MGADPKDARGGEATIRLEEVSRWYGEILGVNKVSVDIRAGITGLVGPNGSGKSTLLNVISGVIRPGQGRVSVLDRPVWNNPQLRRRMGYCSQVDNFYEKYTGLEFIRSMLTLHGRGREWATRTADKTLERVALGEQRDKRIRAYSKGMRQRIKIALALAHEPEVLILDEPFNGLDPVGRREMMRLFEDYARQGRTLLISSHILHEIEQMTDHILMMSNGYVVAEGQVRHVRDMLSKHPYRVYVRCTEPRRLAKLVLAEDGVISLDLTDETSLTLLTRDPDAFFLKLNRIILEHDLEVDVVTLADENVQSIYQYLSGREHH